MAAYTIWEPRDGAKQGVPCPGWMVFEVGLVFVRPKQCKKLVFADAAQKARKARFEKIVQAFSDP